MLKSKVEIWLQRALESEFTVTAGLGLVGAAAVLQRLTRRPERAWETLSQVHRTTRVSALRAAVEPALLRNRDAAWVRPGAADPDKLRGLLGERVVVLKPRLSPAEKGVVIVKFSETIDLIARTVDVPRLLEDYHLVLEPSWSGYCDRSIVYFSQFQAPIFVMAPERQDNAFISSLGSNLIPLPFGPSDWVDPSLSEPFLGRPKRFDILFNSNWMKLKRHYVLFDMMAAFDTKLSVALIGGSVDDRTQDDIRRLARHYGVLDQLSFFQHIPFVDVMRINCESRLAVLLSLKEGSNRAIAESLFCDIPAIVLEEHIGGIRKNIVPETGLLIPERQLKEGVQFTLDHLDSFSPRKWAIEHISCYVTSEILNGTIKAVAARQQESWTADIAPKANSPEIHLVREEDRTRLQGQHQQLSRYFIQP